MQKGLFQQYPPQAAVSRFQLDREGSPKTTSRVAAIHRQVEPVENGVDAKYNPAFATSEDSPMRRIGNRSDTLANIASRSVSAMPVHNGVAIIPGETGITVIA